MSLNNWEKAEKALNNILGIVKDPLATPADSTSVLTIKQMQTYFEKNYNQIKDLLETMRSMDENKPKTTEGNFFTPLYLQGKISNIIKIGESALKRLLTNTSSKAELESFREERILYAQYL